MAETWYSNGQRLDASCKTGSDMHLYFFVIFHVTFFLKELKVNVLGYISAHTFC